MIPVIGFGRSAGLNAVGGFRGLPRTGWRELQNRGHGFESRNRHHLASFTHPCAAAHPASIVLAPGDGDRSLELPRPERLERGSRGP